MQASDFKNEEAIHIVYIMCWEHRLEELITSLKSLHLFAKAALKEGPAFFHVHVISDDWVRQNHKAARKAYLSTSLYHTHIPHSCLVIEGVLLFKHIWASFASGSISCEPTAVSHLWVCSATPMSLLC